MASGGRLRTPRHLSFDIPKDPGLAKQLSDNFRDIYEAIKRGNKEVSQVYNTITNIRTGTPQVSHVLWRWNETDLTQFDTAVGGATSASATSGTVTPSVVSYPNGNRIRFALSSFIGWYGLPIASLVLPRRYVLHIKLHVTDSGTVTAEYLSAFVAGNIGSVSAANTYAIAASIHSGGSHRVESGVLQTANNAAGVTNMNPPDADKGTIITLEVCHEESPSAATPSFSIHRHGIYSSSTNNSEAWGHEDFAAFGSWTGQEMNRVGLGVVQIGATSTGNYEISDMRILRHPMDYP